MASLNEQIQRAEKQKRRRRSLNKITNLKIKNLQLTKQLKSFDPLIQIGSYIINNYGITNLENFKNKFQVIKKDDNQNDISNSPNQFNNNTGSLRER